MSYLLDSDWIISFLNGRADAVAAVRSLADEGIAASVISDGEVLEGLMRTASPAERQVELDELMTTVDVITPDLDVARHYAEIRVQLRAQGLLILDNDIWIAATARAHTLTLVSRDRHFQRVHDLRLSQTE